MTDSLADLDAVELRRMIGTKQISPVELLDDCLKRMDAVEPFLNAVPARCDERARAEARKAEAAVMRGDPLPPLHGLPVGIKDLQVTEGVPTTWGSPLYKDYVADKDERTVAAVRAAGGIVVGKTNVPEWGAGGNTTNPVYGSTRNPYDLDRARICGGSSGGSAAALAARLMPIATGSDTGGSLRIPAGFCGVVGFRPSPGLVPMERRPIGYTPLSVHGPMGRTVADTMLLLQAMVGEDARDPLSHPVDGADYRAPEPCDLSTVRVAVSADLGFAPVEPTIRATFAAAVAAFGGAFAAVEEKDPPLGNADPVFEVLRAVQFLAAHRDRYYNQRDKLGPNIIANYEQGLTYSAEDVAKAQVAHTKLCRDFSAFMERYDVLICPTNCTPPFPVEKRYLDVIDGKPARTYFHWLALTYGLTLTAHPAISLPCGLDATGTPFGIQICGRRGADRQVLAVAAALEAHLQTIPALARTRPDIEGMAKAGKA